MSELVVVGLLFLRWASKLTQPEVVLLETFLAETTEMHNIHCLQGLIGGRVAGLSGRDGGE